MLICCAKTQSLELPVVAELHLYKSMLKSKLILAAPALPSYVSATVAAAPKSQDAALYNIQARLFNSNPVKLAMSETMGLIRAALDIKDTASNCKKTRFGNKASTRQDVETKAVPATIIENSPTKEQLMPAFLGLKDNYSASSGGTRSEGEDSGKENFDTSAYESRLADSSDNDSEQEESTHRPSARNRLLNHHEPSKELSPSPPPSEFSQSSRIVGSKQHKTASSTIRSTTFIPSLTMGGYISGSDSDAASSSTHQNTKPRKNRRGQQERRQIWEKKYGKNANHLKKKSQKQLSQNRDQGWDARKGARADDDDDEKGKHGDGRGGGKWSAGDARKRSNRPTGGGGPTTSGANSDPVQRRNMDDKEGQGKGKQADKPLHPSWEAAKKAKEAKKNVKFQGKKVTFD